VDSAVDVVAQGFAALGVQDPRSFHRTVLFQDRLLVGMRFICGDIQAIWRAEGDTVQFFDQAGNLLSRAPLVVRKAA